MAVAEAQREADAGASFTWTGKNTRQSSLVVVVVKLGALELDCVQVLRPKLRLDCSLVELGSRLALSSPNLGLSAHNDSCVA